MGKLLVPVADHHVRAACHARMHRAVPQQQAEGRVMGNCLKAPDNIARVDIFQAHINALLFAVVFYGIAEKKPDIAVFDIARGIALAGLRQEVLPRAFGNHNHGMAPALQPLFKCQRETP